MALNWFAYLGGNIFSNGSYYRIFGQLPNICSNGCTICAIQLDDDSYGFPSDISSVMDYLGNALVHQVPQPAFPADKYVVMKNCS